MAAQHTRDVLSEVRTARFNALVAELIPKIRRLGPDLSEEALIETAKSAVGVRGIRLAREAADLVRRGVDSPMESRLRLLLVLAGLPEPEVGRPVYSADGGWLAQPDLSYPALKIAIEYDGGHHLQDARQWQRDIRRREKCHVRAIRMAQKKHRLVERSHHGRDVAEERGRVVRFEGDLAAKDLVKDHAERIDVGALVDLLAEDLFRRHVLGRADHIAGLGQLRVALTLRLLCGLRTDEIARAFLVAEPTIAQRVVRAKRTLTEADVPF